MENATLKPGQKVQFRLGDIHLPELTEVLNRMTEDTELQGHITLLSDAGDKQAAFAVVEVKGVLLPIIVPASAVILIKEATKESPELAKSPG